MEANKTEIWDVDAMNKQEIIDSWDGKVNPAEVEHTVRLAIDEDEDHAPSYTLVVFKDGKISLFWVDGLTPPVYDYVVTTEGLVDIAKLEAAELAKYRY